MQGPFGKKKKRRLKYKHKTFSKVSEIQCAGSENLWSPLEDLHYKVMGKFALPPQVHGFLRLFANKNNIKIIRMREEKYLVWYELKLNKISELDRLQTCIFTS